MYSLDVNFLNDRPDIRPQGQGTTYKSGPNPREMTPLILGVVVGLLLPGLVGGLWFVLQQQIAGLEQQSSELDAELARQGAEKQKIAQLQAQVDKVKTETDALASVFNQIKPWSAMLQDIRERIPPGVQIRTIQQTQVVPTQTTASPTPSPAAGTPNAQAASAPTSTSQLEITGTARSFDEVNYLLLTLQRSSFVKSAETQLVRAELVKNANKLEVNVPENRNQGGATVTYELPKVVEYKIQTSISDVPASELLRELDRKGAVGLVTRIRTLQEKGVIQK
jgi:type IV pilus assembly protein PilN